MKQKVAPQRVASKCKEMKGRFFSTPPPQIPTLRRRIFLAMAGKQGRKKARSPPGCPQLRPIGSTVSGSKKPAAATVPSCKYHLSEASVQAVLNHKRVPFVIGGYFDDLTPEEQQLMLEVAAQHEEVEDRYAKYQERVRKELDEKGFVALPDDVDKRRAALNAR